MENYENDHNSSNSCEDTESFPPDTELVAAAEPAGPVPGNTQQDPVMSAPEVPSWEPSPEEAVQGAYRGTGAGKKESPFADSPYYMEYQPQADTTRESEVPPQANAYNHYEAPRKAKKPRQKKAGSQRRGSLIAAALVCAILGGVGGGALTAHLTNSKWEASTSELQSSFQAQIAELQNNRNQTTNSQQPGNDVKPVSNGNVLSPALVYEQTVNSVVAISNQGTGTQWGQVIQTASSGSGFLISEDGYILSNYHVVQNAQTLTVTLYDGTEYPAKVVGYDAVSDVALLKIEATGLTPVIIGSSEDLKVGEQVVAIGNPLGELTSTLTAGYVSAKGRTINTEGTLLNMLQTDAAINPGNSGGPLFNMKGEVVGITTAKYSGSTNSGASIEGIGFAIPIDDVMSILEDLKVYGYVTGQAVLGVEVKDMDTSIGSIYNLPVGPYVNSVTEGGASEKAGVQAGDIIIGLGDYEITNYSDLATALRHFKAGDSTTITVFRSGQKLTLNITLEEKQAPETTPSDTGATEPTAAESTPEDRESGGFDDWSDFFAPFFGGGN